MRIAHLTDPHVEASQNAPEGFQLALEHAQAQKPDLIIMGGDMIADSLATPPEKVQEHWDTYRAVLNEHCHTPIEHCLGNHDVFGWAKPELYRDHPLYGRAWATQELGVQQWHRSMDLGGWHIVFLDSTYPAEGGYTAKLDEAQFEWFTQDLANTSLPTLVVSHIPILGACPFLDGDNETSGDWRVPGAWMHIDARRIKDLFLQHPHVKLCISGHIHLVDQVLYNGVTYCCNGAVCAGWWKGKYQECDFGYALVDLHPDGRFGNRYVPFGFSL